MSIEYDVGLGLEGRVVSTRLANKLCESLGYDRPDLVEIPLRVFAESYQPDAMLSQKNVKLSEGSTNLNCRSILPFLESKLSGDRSIQVELKTNDIGALVSPSNNDSMLMQIIKHLDGTYGKVKNHLPNHDIVNVSYLRKALSGNSPVLHLNNYVYAFNRFSVEIQGNYNVEWPALGLPRVTVTNGFAKQGNHISMQIEIPDRNGKLFKAVNLLVNSDDPMRQESARTLVDQYAQKEKKYLDESLMEMTALCAQISTEKGFYPFGAVFSDYNGNLWIGCNATSKDRETKKHAEYLVLESLPEGTRGHLHTFMAPCPGCTEQIMANNVTEVVYSLGQIPAWNGTIIPLANTLNPIGEKVGFRPDTVSMGPAIALLKKINESEGIFKNQFRQTVALNEIWQSKLQEM